MSLLQDDVSVSGGFWARKVSVAVFVGDASLNKPAVWFLAPKGQRLFVLILKYMKYKR